MSLLIDFDWNTRYIETGRWAVIRKGKEMFVGKKPLCELTAPEYRAECMIDGKWTKLNEEGDPI